MSEPDSAEIGRRIGDHSADIIADDAVACCAAADTARQPDFARHQGEIGHRGRQIHLESRLDPTEVAGLAMPSWTNRTSRCFATYREANAEALRMEWPHIPLLDWPDGE